MKIHIARNGQQLGPYTEQQLAEFLEDGQISLDDTAWKEGMAGWQPLRSIYTPPAGAPTPPPSHFHASQGKKVNPFVKFGVPILVLLIGGLIWLGSYPDGGVMLSNEMDKHARKNLESLHVLVPEEELIAYYDPSISQDGAEAAILTTRRIIYHKDAGNETINLADIEDVNFKKGTLASDVIEIHPSSGKTMRIEIEALNQGASFISALKRAREHAQPKN